MFIPHRILLLLIGCAPMFLVVDDLVERQLVAFLAAIGVATIGATMRPIESAFFIRLLRVVSLLAVVPLLWMFVQILPVPSGLAHPVWTSAKEALGHSLSGHISVDIGVTFLAIGRYLTFAALVALATAVTIDRQRAELTLFTLAAVTTAMAAAFVGLRIWDLVLQSAQPRSSDALMAVSSLGAVLNAAVLTCAVERRETRGPGHLRAAIAFGAPAGALAICLFALILAPTKTPIFVTTCALTAFVVVIIIRRLGLSRWIATSFAATVAVVLIAIGLTAATNKSPDLTLRYASDGSPSAISLTERLKSDTGWAGTGAGTFDVMTPIYRDADQAPLALPPTSAAAIAIELGSPALVAILLLSGALTALMFRGALRRGRDSFFPMAAACGMIAVMLELFCDASLLSTTTAMIVAVMIGLGWAQSVSRSVQSSFGPV